ncbi:1-aminocyclopropane-1-carboxylate oxidase like 1 [Apostasia shenzhenica]|uniref:1-aminocyclopropane-1-carboxylate oxidase like 1 n=1 Tax=Apostasia shenzhenica TaxID=1088818 RepID=A0A2I0B8N1_9ASPA|nr:1-aminocyclopropane-1-carboxylate oxidase like 1 [Apostasia shenzhenica]
MDSACVAVKLSINIPPPPAGNDAREQLLRMFDETKAGVKGLVDAGVEELPEIFVHSPEHRAKPAADAAAAEHGPKIPMIDLDGVAGGDSRRKIVEEVLAACEEWGLFYVVNHGIPGGVLEEALEAARRFHEQDVGEKKKVYSRDMMKTKVRYNSNYGLYNYRAATWKDTLFIEFDGVLKEEDIPHVCRKSLWEYRERMVNVGLTLGEILSEALGLPPDHLQRLGHMENQYMFAHYYPPCPSPELTLGSTPHGDPSFITLLLQDSVGGLQCVHDDRWVNVDPVDGALIVNVGDIMQIMSNGRLRSPKHRVLSSKKGPRISVASFFARQKFAKEPMGPIQELLSENNPAIYRQISNKEFLESYTSKYHEARVPDLFKLS